MTVLLAASDGGYSTDRGWDGKTKPVVPAPIVTGGERDAHAAASTIEDGEDLSVARWKRIATHGREAEDEARQLCSTLELGEHLARVVVLAARWHDAGKAHPTFQDAIKVEVRQTAPIGARRDLAKAPDSAWKRPPYPDRPGFRHELASTLALFELLRRTHPLHPALLGPHRELLDAIGTPLDLPAEPAAAHPLADEIAELSAEDFDLLAWLVCTHHGKVRSVWTSTPHDQEKRHGGIHGVCEGDVLPAFALTDARGHETEIPALTLSLVAAEMGVGPRYGASWGERVMGLLVRHGPFALTFLEAVLRVADWRATKLTTEDLLA
jgi:CRISPR-associated endonuclease/helicase Cas3